MSRYIINGKEVPVRLPNCVSAVDRNMPIVPARVVKLGPTELDCFDDIVTGPQSNAYVENWAETGERYDIYQIDNIGDHKYRFWIGGEDQVVEVAHAASQSASNV